VPHALHRDRPAAPPCLATARRRWRSGAASGLHQARRPPRARTRHAPPHHPPRCASPAATWPRRAHSPRRASASSCPVPGPSRRSGAGGRPWWRCSRALCGIRPAAARCPAALEGCRSTAPARHATTPVAGAREVRRPCASGVRGVRVEVATTCSQACSCPCTSMTAQKIASVRWPRDQMHSRMFEATVYEIFRLKKLPVCHPTFVVSPVAAVP
jgi:hypothetical protein